MIAVGVDTHKHQHLAVAVDALGQLLAEITITATLAGYRQLLAWIAELEGEVRVGIEGAGSYGAGLCEHLQYNGFEVFEVDRPKRRERRTGKSDRLDALLAAKKVLTDDGLSTPRGHGKRVALLVAERLTRGVSDRSASAFKRRRGSRRRSAKPAHSSTSRAACDSAAHASRCAARALRTGPRRPSA
jgi:transposase